ncbi:hypothetical protein OROHE_014148 [Orobanche hederae]
MVIESASPSYWPNESPESTKLSPILNQSTDLTSLFDSGRIAGFDFSLFATLVGIVGIERIRGVFIVLATLVTRFATPVA